MFTWIALLLERIIRIARQSGTLTQGHLSDALVPAANDLKDRTTFVEQTGKK